jgi:GH15 family glucan-1,4-alpha-glucosidase
MNPVDHLPIPFPPIHYHGIAGDQRTAALLAADGAPDWFCVPDFDGPPLFGALLDPPYVPGQHAAFIRTRRMRPSGP